MRVKYLIFCIVLLLTIVSGGMEKNVFADGYDDSLPAEIDQPNGGDCESVADFIEENTDEFVFRINQVMSEENDEMVEWNAAYVENRLPITIDECGEIYSGVFIDFDGNNGYAVIGDDYDLLDLTTFGESPYLGIETSEYYFSSSYGYLYYSEEKDGYMSVLYDYSNSNEFCELPAQSYAGQEVGCVGCGAINDTDAYVQDKYGDGWFSDVSHSIPMNGFDQFDLSCYHETKLKSTATSITTKDYSEGNCWVVSAFHILQCFADSEKLPGMPHSSQRIYYSPSNLEPNIYSLYYDRYGNNLSQKIYYNNTFAYKYSLANTSFYFPELYSQIRQHVDYKYGQINDGGYTWQTSEIIESVANYYGNSINAVEIPWYAPVYIDSVKKLNEDMPLILSTQGCTYGAHSMAVCGYKYYKKETGWWIFRRKQYKLFYELKDGWVASSRYFDRSAHWGFDTLIYFVV